jgi:hypothetical protein
VTDPQLIELAMRIAQTDAPIARQATDVESQSPQQEPAEVQVPRPSRPQLQTLVCCIPLPSKAQSRRMNLLQ